MASEPVMVDYGIVLGLLGVASGAASLIYSRSQVVAARREARWEYTRVYRGSNQSSSSRSRRDFLILNLSSSSSLSSKVGPSETQWSVLEIQTQRGCRVCG